MACLAAQMEQLAVSLPGFVQQVENGRDPPGVGPKQSALQQPLGSLTMPRSQLASAVQRVWFGRCHPAKYLEGRAKGQQHRWPRSPPGLGAGGEDDAGGSPTPSDPSHLGAVQSSVSSGQSDGSDPLGDFVSSSMGFSSRGATGHQKVEQELALHRGTFYQAVMSAMARRMQPARSSEAQPGELLTKGVAASAYVKRFGGYGHCRDIGQIMWMVSLVMDHLQTENLGAVKDAVVCLEQTALDNGRMDIGLLLALQEDPPAALFTNRSLANYSKGKAFAPLADQKG